MDVIEVVTEIETVGDYGMQVTDVVDTFHVQGKCVGCDHSLDSWCSKRKAWGYAINDCIQVEPFIKTKSKKLVLKSKVPWNAKPITCTTNGKEFTSIKKAAEYAKTDIDTMRRIVTYGLTHNKKKYKYAEDVKNG